MMDDRTIIENYLKFKKYKESQNKPSSESKYLISKFITKQEKEYIKNRWIDSSSNYESLYRIVHNIQEKPRCPVCGKFTEFINKNEQIYRKYCSWECKKKNTNMVERHKQGCLKKYGVENISQVESIKEKKEQTFLKHFGTKNNFGRPEVTQTFINKYGVTSIQKLQEIVEKTKQTNLKKYGYVCFLAIPEEREKWKESNKEKDYFTRKKNGTFGKSKIEENLFLRLKEIFSDIKSQYRDKERYPFRCDFYIPNLDLFIEYQGFVTHMKCEYDPNNVEHQNILEKFIEKKRYFEEVKNRKTLYEHIINVWTISDPKKRKIAKENNLNFIEIWPDWTFEKILDEIKKYQS